MRRKKFGFFALFKSNLQAFYCSGFRALWMLFGLYRYIKQTQNFALQTVVKIFDLLGWDR